MIYQIGPTREYKTPSEVLRSSLLAKGDVLEIDAGTYKQDAVFAAVTKAVTIKGVGGKAVFDGAFVTPTIYNGQAINPFDTPDGETDPIVCENIEWINASGSPGNVAGVKLNPNTSAVFRNCAFKNCQNGYMSSAGTQTVLFENCEFANCGTNSGQQHNIYDGGSAEITLRGCWSHDSKGGQLYKARAVKHNLEYCRFDGMGNYELDFPNGGDATVIGCLIKQVPIGATTNNKAIINYGREGNLKPVNRLRLAYCTIINEQEIARMIVSIQDPSVVCEVSNCIIQSGPGFVNESDAPNYTTPGTVKAPAGLVGPDFKLLANSAAINTAVEHALKPTHQYTLNGVVPRVLVNDVGALDEETGSEPSPVIVWSVIGGALPPGLALSDNGVISGIPTQVGTYTVDIKAELPDVSSAIKSFSITISAQGIVITSTSPLPSGEVGKEYSTTLVAVVQ